MEFNQYNTTVQQWIHTVLENRETNADVVLECCRDIIAYGRETDDPKLMGFGFFYGGEIYYELNDGAHFFHMMTEALTYLDRAEEWELVVRCYNFLGIASMSLYATCCLSDYLRTECTCGYAAWSCCLSWKHAWEQNIWISSGHWLDCFFQYD